MSIERLQQWRDSITPTDTEAEEGARQRHLTLAKPPGSLGVLEDLGVRLAGISGNCPPPVPTRAAAIIAAADHGVHAQGVSPWPQSLTGLMVANFIQGGASANALAEANGVWVSVIDAGVNGGVPHGLQVHRAPVTGPTRDLSRMPAMDTETASVSIAFAAAVAGEMIDGGAQVIIPGDMGIANTTAAAALIAAFGKSSAAEVTGRGTGIDDDTLKLKTTVVDAALERHGSSREPLITLASLGGLEHAAMVGLIMAAASYRVPVILDGVNAVASALVAQALQPHTVGYMIAGHRSVEPAATIGLRRLGLSPLLDLDMRLGEGTGAISAYPLLKGAAALLHHVATLEEMGVTPPDA
ncbi:nicotinate-nucleotide--dimethylbenzimidazole phosphoribosyltransferase [Haloglycomyces albus]|uniref:nicotinate-nucleotide--dimethylbenzimidazole phosphoribosyltransferase n=1 Tax=Haloglycomyces albus TaxID=526067 RepID=UPI00046D437D|nr:nicotinate-nucleotide--dimethylbenzimidazole phosphoribosyltransferase [Haloglycomyces albus]